MNQRGTGAIFCLIAALLYAARYITAATLVSNGLSMDRELFLFGLEVQGSGLLILSVASLIVGICYLIWGEVEASKKG